MVLRCHWPDQSPTCLERAIIYSEDPSGNYTEATSALQPEQVNAMKATGSATRPHVDRGMRADARRNYERLLSAAAAAFAEHGDDDVSLAAIAMRRGGGVGHL